MAWTAGVVFCLLTAGAYGLLALALFYDIPPKAALYRVARRLGIVLARLKPEQRDAPYRRMGPVRRGLHRPVLLNLETSDGSGQACHPDVACIPEGFGAGKWTYWMACTPYPYGEAYFENPEIFAGYDGIHWTVPSGLTNPLVDPLKVEGDHNSDPDILFHQHQLWMFYRETLRSRIPTQNNIYLIKSADGIRWSPRVQILTDQSGAELLSPAVVHDRTCFWMWTVELQEGSLKLMRRSSPDGIHWVAAPQVCGVTGLQIGRQPWHIDVIREEERLSAVLVSCTGLGGAGSRIHYAFSEDGGKDWSAGELVLEPVYEFESAFRYRASLQRRQEHPERYELWYTAASQKHVFSIAYARMFRKGNKLEALAPSFP